MIRYSFTACLLAFGILSGFGQKSPEQIVIPSQPAAPDMVWEGGERSQVSQWDGLATASNISQPSLTVYKPAPGTANGTALIIAPGGGFHTLSMVNEGSAVAEWCAARGITAFVLKYRLVPTGENPGQEFMEKLQRDQAEMDRQMRPFIELAVADGRAAIAYVREHAKAYGVDPARIGIIGFSAGGTVAAGAALTYTSEAERPDFSAPIYAALHVLDYLTPPKDKIPTFLAVAEDDFFGFQKQTSELYFAWNAAGIPTELHHYPKGGHGFGMRTQNLPSDAWITAFADWLGLLGLL